MKKSIKILIVFITTLVMITIVNINASVGYTYDHRGDPIYSTAGFTINQTPFLANDLQIPFNEFGSPEDFYVYTDENNETVIYIVDSSSNKLFVLDSNLKLTNSISEFKLNVNNFSDDVLREIKSGGNYVVLRDQILSIPQSMEDVNLVPGSTDEVEIIYNVRESDQEYIVKWVSENEEIATVDEKEENFFIVAKALGTTNIVGSLYSVNDEENALEKVTIKVRVTETPEPAEVGEKNHGFSLSELRAKGTINLKLKGVSGVYRNLTARTNEDFIYLCDSGNNQVVVIDSKTYEIVKFITTPKGISFEKFIFSPKEVVTDRAGRMYVIADNVYEGIMQFSREGEFNRYTGVNYITLSPWDAFWRNFSTEEQLSKQKSIINTSFTSMAVDKEGFIYTTTTALKNDSGLITDDNNMVKRINPTGEDVLRRNGYQPPKGDVQYVLGTTDSTINGPSTFGGITVNDIGVYTILDSKMGRLYTYDFEGNLLYISGEGFYIKSAQKPSEFDVLTNPVAVRYFGEDILVLDKNNKALILFEPTDIARLINKAVEFEYYGDKMSAANIWVEVIKQNANYEYAYIGIGRMYLENKDYATAMKYFKYGRDRALYSRAFKMKRDATIRKYFTPVVLTIFVCGTGLYILKKVKHRNDPKVEDTGMGDE